MPAALLGDFEDASVTLLRAGRATDGGTFIVAAGLSGRLRAWVARGDAVCWVIALDDNSDDGPHSALCTCAADRAVAAARAAGKIVIWCTSTWSRLFVINPSLSTYGENWSPACLAASSEYLACGSREGLVQIWQSNFTPDESSQAGLGRQAALGFKRCWKRAAGHRADVGPVAALVLHPEKDLVLGAYALLEGFVHGKYFRGSARLVAWHLTAGTVLWRVPSPEAQLPTVFACASADSLWLVHADSEPAAGLQRTMPADRAAGPSSAAVGAVLLRTIALAPLALATPTGTDPQAPKDLPPLDSYPEAATPTSIFPASEARRALAFAAASDGSSMAIGFSGGGVALVLRTSGDPTRSRVLLGQSALPADVATVLLVEGGRLASDAEVIFGLDGMADATAPTAGRLPPRLIAGSAASYVSLWAVRGAALESLASIALPQPPCSLSFQLGVLACGCSDGALWMVHASTDGPETLPALDCDASATTAATARTAAATPHASYDYRFRSREVAGRIQEHPLAFERWVCSAEFERRQCEDKMRERIAARGEAIPEPGAMVLPSDWRASIRNGFARGELPKTHVAACARALHVRGLLQAEEVYAIRQLSETLPWTRAHPAAARQTCYLSGGGVFGARLPGVLDRLLIAMREADDNERWGAFSGRHLSPRCIECHRLSAGHDILDRTHYDHGSVLTIDVMLSPAGEFHGGQLQTVEAGGALSAHELECGGACATQ